MSAEPIRITCERLQRCLSTDGRTAMTEARTLRATFDRVAVSHGSGDIHAHDNEIVEAKS